MDLFSRFPESNKQGQIFSKINEENLTMDDFDINESNEDVNSKSSNKFENLQKVNSLRNRNLIFMSILILLIILFSYIIPNILIDLSLELIVKYSIKEKITIDLFFYINEIAINSCYIFAIILYLYYPLNFSFTYILSLIIIEIINSLIYSTYGVDREKDKKIEIFYRNGSEKPDIQIIKIVVIFFGFWRLLKSKKRDKNELNRYKKINNIILIICFIMTILIFLKQCLVEKYSLKGCFLGLFEGFLAYTFIFERMCIQFMKPNFFMNYINGNYWFFIFASIIPFFVVVYMFNNYNKLIDVLEIYKNIPFYLSNNLNYIDQHNMNRLCLMKSLISFLLISIVTGIRNNYQFVTSKKNNNSYKLVDIVLFSKNNKVQEIIKKTIMYILIGIIFIALMIYVNYCYEVQFIYYLVVEIIIYYIFGIGLFGYGIKSLLKKNIDEATELEEYQNLELSEGSTPKMDNQEIEGRI